MAGPGVLRQASRKAFFYDVSARGQLAKRGR